MVKQSKLGLSVSRINEILGLSNKSKKTKKLNTLPNTTSSNNVSRMNLKNKKGKKGMYTDDTTLFTEDKGKKDKKGKKEKKEKKTKKSALNISPVLLNKSATVLSNPLCDTCLNVVKSDKYPGSLKSANVEDWKEANMHIPLLGESNNKVQEVHIELGKQYAGRLVYYFSAKSINKSGLKKYPTVYHGSTNNGLVVLDSNGCGVAKVDCPSVYLDVPPKTINKKGLQAYMNHIHYIVSDKKMTKWDTKMFTQNVLCKISKAEYEIHTKNNTRIVLNALEPKYNIPGTNGNLHYKEADKMTTQQLHSFVYKLLNDKLKQQIDKCGIENIPLIVYCHNPKCDAAKHLATTLYKAGFYNILYYPEGFLGYHGRY